MNWPVPAGVNAIEVQATGAAGVAGLAGTGVQGGRGGFGDRVSATLSDLAAGDVASVCVDWNGPFTSSGGFSSVEVGSAAVVAGGGGSGGNGGSVAGGDGGSAGMPKAGAGASVTSNGQTAGGGGAGDNTIMSGGGGGGVSTADSSCNGQMKAGNEGGGGGFCGGGPFGGVGGGGFNGGGGGAGGSGVGGGGGGGGGTDFCSTSLELTGCTVSSGAGTQTSAGSAAGDAQVTITYTMVTVTNPGNQTSTVLAPVNLQMSATDSDTSQTTFTWSASGLPAGVGINSSTGLISGPPTTKGTFIVTVTAKDTTGEYDSASFTWTVNPLSTSTSVSCSSTSVAVGQATTCTATVMGLSLVPTGTVSFLSHSPGSFSGSPCTLNQSGIASASCSVTYTPTDVGSHTIMGSYSSDSVYAGSSGNQSVNVTPAADLTITNTDGQATYVPGTSVTYTIVVSNSGPSPVVGATVTDVFPAAIVSDVSTASATGGATGFTASGSGNINDTVTMPVNSTITYTVTASISPSATGNLVNTASVTPPANVTDPNPNNNMATDTDTLAAADLSISNSAPPSVVSGDTLTYKSTATNSGGQDATGVTVIDPFSGNEHLNLVSASTTQGTCSTKGGTVKCSLGTLSGGSSATITIKAIATTPGTFTNKATVTATPPVTGSGDSAKVTTTVIGT
jgi:uncharacterized repeat protein (TIGR01451 family)